MALRAALERLAVAGRVEMAAEIDRVIGRSAIRLVPMIRMAFRARGLSDGTSLKGVAVACGAIEKGLAVTSCMIRPAEAHVVSRSGGHARSAVTCAQRIISIPAARHRQGEKDANKSGAKRFLVHNRLLRAQHVQSIQGL